jgi:hypothetical protein
MGANDNVVRGREYNRECDFGKNSLTGPAYYLPARRAAKIDTMEALSARANRKLTDPSKVIRFWLYLLFILLLLRRTHVDTV